MYVSYGLDQIRSHRPPSFELLQSITCTGMAHHSGPKPPRGTFRLFSSLLQPAPSHRIRLPRAHVRGPLGLPGSLLVPPGGSTSNLGFNRPQGFPCTLKLEQHRSRELSKKGSAGWGPGIFRSQPNLPKRPPKSLQPAVCKVPPFCTNCVCQTLLFSAGWRLLPFSSYEAE